MFAQNQGEIVLPANSPVFKHKKRADGFSVETFVFV